VVDRAIPPDAHIFGIDYGEIAEDNDLASEQTSGLGREEIPL
jgi:hypothetical protein